MGQNRQFVENWLDVLSTVLNDDSVHYGDAFTVGKRTDELGEACAGLEWKISITSGVEGDVDVNLHLYSAPDGTTPYGTEPKSTQLLTRSGLDPYYNSGIMTEDDLGSGGRFGVQNTGAGDGESVHLWIRRYRYV